MQNSAMTVGALSPKWATHLGHGRSPVLAASASPFPVRIGSRRNLVGLQYGLSPGVGAKCTQGRWRLVARDCMDHARFSNAGTSLSGSSQRRLSGPRGRLGKHPGSDIAPWVGQAPWVSSQWRRNATAATLHWPPGSVVANRLVGDAALAIRLLGAKRLTSDAPLAIKLSGG